MSRIIVVIPGDFIGPEVTKHGLNVLKAICAAVPSLNDIQFVEKEAGGHAIDKYEKTLPDDTFEACKNAMAIFFGSVGGPKWTGAQGDDPMQRPEWALLTLRKSLQLYANIRPTFFPAKSLVDASPLKKKLVEGVDFIVLRENSGGCYFGKQQEDNGFDGMDIEEGRLLTVLLTFGRVFFVGSVFFTFSAGHTSSLSISL
jgi:3-isopropylmalate dehydrogenase